MSEPLGLLASAELLGHYRYVELECFVRLGTFAPRAEQPEVAGYLAGAARAHAYRAGLVEALLPVSVGLPGAAALTVSPDGRLDGALDELLAQDEEALLGELVLVVYPALLAAYRAHLDCCSIFSDPPLRRCLMRLLADLAAQIELGEPLVAAHSVDQDLAFGGLLECLGDSFRPGRPAD